MPITRNSNRCRLQKTVRIEVCSNGCAREGTAQLGNRHAWAVLENCIRTKLKTSHCGCSRKVSVRPASMYFVTSICGKSETSVMIALKKIFAGLISTAALSAGDCPTKIGGLMGMVTCPEPFELQSAATSYTTGDPTTLMRSP